MFARLELGRLYVMYINPYTFAISIAVISVILCLDSHHQNLI